MGGYHAVVAQGSLGPGDRQRKCISDRLNRRSAGATTPILRPPPGPAGIPPHSAPFTGLTFGWRTLRESGPSASRSPSIVRRACGTCLSTLCTPCLRVDGYPVSLFPRVTTWYESAPSGPRLDVSQASEILTRLAAEASPSHSPEPPKRERTSDPGAWPEHLWSVSAETPLGVSELSDALGRPRSSHYPSTHRHHGIASERRPRPVADLIPCHKLGVILRFRAGKVRTRVRTEEEVVAGWPADSARVGRSR